uniref:Uncharacterized protein n=1 Tax=Oryza nivara TaxID=4536 RepID=A0A0E0IIR1_ORYNI
MTKPRNRHHPYPKALLRKKKAGNKEGEMEWNCKNCGRIKIKSLREGDVQPPSPGSQGAPAQRLDQGQVGMESFGTNVAGNIDKQRAETSTCNIVQMD